MQAPSSHLELGAPLPRYGSHRDWSRLSGLSRATTDRLIADGQIRALKVGRRTLIDFEQALAFLESRPPLRLGRNAA